MKNVIRRLLVLLLCVTLFIGDNATHIFASEVETTTGESEIELEAEEEAQSADVDNAIDVTMPLEEGETDEDILPSEIIDVVAEEEVDEMHSETQNECYENDSDGNQQDVSDENYADLAGDDTSDNVNSEPLYDGIEGINCIEISNVRWSDTPGVLQYEERENVENLNEIKRILNDDAVDYQLFAEIIKDGEVIAQLDSCSYPRLDIRAYIDESGKYTVRFKEKIYRFPRTVYAVTILETSPIFEYIRPDNLIPLEVPKYERIENGELLFSSGSGTADFLIEHFSSGNVRFTNSGFPYYYKDGERLVCKVNNYGDDCFRIKAVSSDIYKYSNVYTDFYYYDGTKIDSSQGGLLGPSECYFVPETASVWIKASEEDPDNVQYWITAYWNGKAHNGRLYVKPPTTVATKYDIYGIEACDEGGTLYYNVIAYVDNEMTGVWWESEHYTYSENRPRVGKLTINKPAMEDGKLVAYFSDLGDACSRYEYEVLDSKQNRVIDGTNYGHTLNSVLVNKSYLEADESYTIKVRAIPSDFTKYKASEWAVSPSYKVTQEQLNAESLENEYSVGYMLNGGINNASNPYTYKKGATVTFKNPTKQGYTFAGWFDSSTGKKVTSVTGKNITVYANWNPVKYTITYNLNGGTIPSTETKIGSYTVESEDVTFPTPVKTNYTFDGWYTDSKFNNTVTGIESGSTGNVTLYAKWAEISHSITYVMNDTAEDAANNLSANVFVENKQTTLKTPVRMGFTFTGFYKVDPESDEFNAKTDKKVTTIAAGNKEDITLYAGWNENSYKVVYNANGGSLTGKMPTETYKYTDDFNIKQEDILKERTGYTFVGWNTSSKGTGTAYTPGQGVSRLNEKNGATVTLYAQWSVNEYVVEYELNGGEQPRDKKGNELNPYAHTYVKAVALKNPTRAGYSFGGWFADENFEGKKLTSITKVNDDIKLYAKWNPVSYKLTYNLNGGKFEKGVKSTASFNIETETFDLIVPERVGYDFNGWYTDKKFTTPIDKLEIGTTGNKAVYAKWTGIPYVLSYHYDDNPYGTVKSITYNYAVKNKLESATALEYVRDGYKLTGWTAQIGGKTKKYANGAAFQNLTTVRDEVIEMYPVWTPIVYNVTFNANGGKGTVKAQKIKGDNDFVLPVNTFKKTGFTANGWIVTVNGEEKHYADGENLGLLTTKDNDKIVIKADYIENEYKVVFIEQGSESAESITTKYTEAIMLPNNASEVEGSIFVGWNTRADGKGTNYSASQTVSKLVTGGEITLYAKYAAINSGKFIIRFMSNGGNGFINPAVVNYNASYALPTKGYSKTGDKLIGWTDDKGNFYKTGEKVRAYKKGGTLTLYAQWQSGDDVLERPVVDNSPAVKSINDSLAAGNHIIFGSYEQDGDMSNGAEPIEWEVLEVKNGYATLISKYVLDYQCCAINDDIGKCNTWETQGVRKWLNSEFYNEAFSEKQKAAIATTAVNNVQRGRSFGKKTNDKLYILSAEEILGYYGLSYKQNPYGYWDSLYICACNMKLLAKPSQYTKQIAPGIVKVMDEDTFTERNLESYGFTQDIIGQEYSDYWLRCPGYLTAMVTNFGNLAIDPLSNEGWTGVRPTCRIDIAKAEELLGE